MGVCRHGKAGTTNMACQVAAPALQEGARRASVSSIHQESRSSSVSDWRCFGKEGIMLLFYDATRGLLGDELTHLNIIQREPNL